MTKPPGNKGDAVALISITGMVRMPPTGSDTLINAQLVFRFPTPSRSADDASVVEAHGAIVELRMARSSTSPLPGNNGRLKQARTWELTLHRDLKQVGDPLAIPNPAPIATPENSWLSYDDPQGRFHFRHPQDLHYRGDPELEKEGSVILGDDRAGTNDGRVVTLNFLVKSGNPEVDRKTRDPEFHKSDLNEEWARDKVDPLRGPADWLPEADWAPYKMKVFRIEAALNKNASRLFLDHYIVLFSQNEGLVIDAMTGQDPPIAFRQQVEGILKTFALGPSVKPPS